MSSILDYFDEVNEISWKHHKKFQKLIKKKILVLTINAALWDIGWLLESKYNMLLKLFVKNREMYITQVVDELLKDKRYKEKIGDLDEKAHYKRIERYIKDLLRWKLIKVSREEKD